MNAAPLRDAITVRTTALPTLPRILASLRLSLPRLAAGGAGVGAAFALATLVLSYGWDFTGATDVSRWSIVFGAGGAMLGLVLAFGVIGVVVRALDAPPVPKGMPRAVTFTEDDVVVEDDQGAVARAGWSYFTEARPGPGRLTLVLRGAPPRVLEVGRATLAAEAFDRLVR